MCNWTYTRMYQDILTAAKGHPHACKRTYSHLQKDILPRATGHTHTCNRTYSHVQQDILTRSTGHAHTCKSIRSQVCVTNKPSPNLDVFFGLFVVFVVLIPGALLTVLVCLRILHMQQNICVCICHRTDACTYTRDWLSRSIRCLM